MEDADFEVLKVRASIAPMSEGWPTPDYSKVSIAGDKPRASAIDLHWDALRSCVSDFRSRALKTLGAIAGVDEDRALSPEGKAERKKQIATKAITDMEKSPALAKAQAAVSEKVKRFDEKLALPAIDPMIAAEIRRHVAGLKEGDRVPFVTRHIAEAGPAVMQAPAFLSGLSPVELAVVRQQFETNKNPEVARAKAQALDALAHAEAGFRNAANQIRSRAGLDKIGNGGGMAAA